MVAPDCRKTSGGAPQNNWPWPRRCALPSGGASYYNALVGLSSSVNSFIMSRNYRKITLLLFLLSLLGNPAAPVREVEAQGALDSRFGAVEAFWAPNEAAALGIGWERLLFYWNQLQPFGPADWNTLHVADEWLAEAAAQGRTVIGLLKNTPQWATDGPPSSGVPRGLFLPIDDPGNLWATFTRRVVSYYGERGVHHWIIWNEPDIAPDVYGHEFGGTVDEYYRLLKVAYQVSKAVDPSATIHLGGMTYWHDPGYLRRFLAVVKADPEAAPNNYFFDVISLHIYFRPETIPQIVGSTFGVQQELGIQPLKPVWINETNARPNMDPEWPVEVQSFYVDLEQQAWYIVQAYALGFYAGAARISVYKLVDINMSPGDESWGLVRPYDFSKRPAYFAYQNTIKYLSGFTYPVQRQQTAAYTIVGFYRPQGLTRVLWARGTAPLSLEVPALAPSGMLVDPITDTKTPVTAVNGVYQIGLLGAVCHVDCLIGGPPVFLIEDGVQQGQIPTSVPPPPPTSTPLPTPVETATSATTSTATPTETSTPSATPSETPTPTPSDTPTPTATNSSTPTATATTTGTEAADERSSPVPTATATISQLIADRSASSLAAATPITAPVEMDDASPNGEDRPVLQSWWFLGAGLGLAALLLWVGWGRRRS